MSAEGRTEPATYEAAYDGYLRVAEQHQSEQTATWRHFADLGVDSPESMATLLVHYYFPLLEP